MVKKYIIVQTHTNKKQVYEDISRSLIEKRMAACVNIYPAVLSIYRYNSEVVEDNEYLIHVKTTADKFDEIRKIIERLHNYLCLLAGGKIHASDLPISQSEFLSPDEAFVMSHEVVDDKHIKINWKIHPGYYLYMGMFEFESLDKENLIQKVKMPDGET